MRTERPTRVLAGRYSLLLELGRDGAGARWLARDAMLEREVEVRVLRPPFAEEPDLAASLSQALARAARASAPGLAPERVILTPDGRALLRDLGLGQAVHAAGRRDATALLAPASEPPEPLAERDRPADVFGAAAVLFEALTGRPPGAERSPRGLRPEVRPALDLTIRLGLAPDPSERPEARPTQEEPPPPAPRTLPIVAVRTFDPFGDRRENDDAAARAIDGDPATAWRSENYFDGVLHKPGFGLLLDLGRERAVMGFRLQAPHPGYRFGLAVGDDPTALVSAARATFAAGPEVAGILPEARGRYVLVWIVSVVDAGDGNRAEIAEVEVLADG